MLRLAPFALLVPATLDEAIAQLAEHGSDARVLAGGTDVLPNLKLGLPPRATVLVSLRRLTELRGVSRQGDELVLGAGATLDEISLDPLVRASLPALAEAAASAASPQLRRMGTLGGNLCLDTRCQYVNQSELFREALGGCLKSHGDACHVVPGGQDCVAALSCDTLPALVAYEARVELRGPGGTRVVPVEEIRASDGAAPLRLGASEIVTRVRVRIPPPTTLCAARKWSVRRAIDFPLVSLAVRLDRAQSGAVTGGKLVLGALGPKPKVALLDDLAGSALDEALAARVGQIAFAQAKTLPNLPYDPAYRRERAAVEARRAVRSLLARSGS